MNGGDPGDPRPRTGLAQLSKRPYAPSDAADLAAMLNALEEHVGFPPSSTPAQLGQYLATALVDPARDATLRLDPDGGIVAAGLVIAPPPGGDRVWLFGGVHPTWRARGIGEELLRWQFARAARLRAASGTTATWTGHATTPVQDEAAIHLYRRFGMTARRYWTGMGAPTAGARPVPFPTGLRAESYQPDFARVLYAADTEAFAGQYATQVHDYERWAPRHVERRTFLPELCVLAFDGDELAGYVIPHRGAEPATAYVGHLGVRARWRRRGLATSMLTMLLATAARAGWRTVRLQVDAENPHGATGMYERIGFTATTRTVTYELAVPSAPSGADELAGERAREMSGDD